MTTATKRCTLRIAVGIATAGRRDGLTQTLKQLNRQDRAPDMVFICPAAESDLDETVLSTLLYPTQVVRSGRGITIQRNAILDLCGEHDVIIFFDDDFYPRPDYLAQLEQLMLADAGVAGVTGYVVADGNLTEGIPHEEALRTLTEHRARDTEVGYHDTYNLYGCNMAYRMSALRSTKARFDEALPLYGWLEDVDFSRQVVRAGRLVRSFSMVGVHLATKRGRTSGLRFGYSQVANPVYMVRKGTLLPRMALHQIAKNIARNAQRSFAPEWWIDRRSRLVGNAQGVRDLLLGTIDPRKVLHIE